MEKLLLIELTETLKSNVEKMLRQVKEYSGKQIQKKLLLAELTQMATPWFDSLEVAIRAHNSVSEEIINKYREQFASILEMATGRPSKSNMEAILQEIRDNISREIIIPIKTTIKQNSQYDGFEEKAKSLSGIEYEYLKEALECAKLGKRRASVILGWSAAISRLQDYVEKSGFQRFNRASVEASAIQSGRYKRFNNKYEIHNLADLRSTVFDSNLLWILEYLGDIDQNQHDRLEICYTMRNTSAHPGEAIMSDENLLSFFSDIYAIILLNTKFSINETET